MHAFLAITRAVHIGSALLLFGELVFVLFVARPAFRAVPERPLALRSDVERGIRSIGAWSLAVSIASGVVWLVLEAPLMSGLAMREALGGGTLGVVLTQTSFGRTWMLRGCLAFALGATLLMSARSTDDARGSRWSRAAALVAAGYLATLAFAGHAAGGQGQERYLRIGVDMVHLLAAGAWLGALPGLVFVLRRVRSDANAASVGVAARSTRRFSALGTVAVGALLFSGVANAWYEVRALDALFATEYGKLLLAKLALFAAMLALAAVNRWRLSPRVAAADRAALRSLARNAMLETTLGIAVIAIVGVLGVTIPAMHPLHHHELHSGTSRAMITSSLALEALHGRTHQAR